MKDIFSKPNQITYIRILLIPVLAAFMLMDFPNSNYVAAFVFIILSLSDALDGYLARKHKQITSIGKILDPIADKLLIVTALILLIPKIPMWMVVVILARELIITCVRFMFLKKKVVPASILGKLKTVTQMVAIVAVILGFPIGWWIMLLAVIITVISGLDYIIKIPKAS
ncbi:CDP-diacylglycerol--glycerol-3-phosphate 3-phosphatidyltransferase [Candidatus Woesearchaeota archaeon]|nr:CDP-diacylglycerol--glycerol-3-phosphate 3-phosphatidyltransferase [Candidatus Woesearchaeota archaeon]